MVVTYPMTEDVLNSIHKGNLALTYSNPQNKIVVGNLCPHCSIYQGNTYVRFQVIPKGAFYPLEKYVVGFFDAPIKCEKCGRIEDANSDSFFSKLCYYENYLSIKESCDRVKSRHPDSWEEYTYMRWICDSCLEKERLEKIRLKKEEQEQERIEKNMTGPLIECPLCKKNSKDNPKTRFMEHHISYSPEVKMWVCVACNNKIHKTNQYPDLKPKDKYITRKEAKALKEVKLQQELKTGIAPDEYCVACGKRYRKNDITVTYEGHKIHQKCIPKREPPKKGKFYFM
jgi:hypothetical protein